MSPPRTIKFRCSDDLMFKVDEAVAIRSPTVKSIIENAISNDGFYVLDTPSYIAARSFRWLQSVYVYLSDEASNDRILDRLNRKKIEYNSGLYTVGVRILEEELKSRNALDALEDRKAEFVDVDDVTLFELIRGVKYLKIQELLDVTRENLFQRIRGNININIPRDIRELFNIESQLTPEEGV